MKIVVLDGHTVNPGDNPWDGLAALGELVVHARTDAAQILSLAQDAEILLVNKTPLTAATLAELSRLRFICELATGYDNIDISAAGTLGIPVANIPGYSADSVAQHTMALLLELCNRVGSHDRAVHAGEWSRSSDFSFWNAPLMELTGKKIGIVGMGRIGRRVAQIASAFGMEILAHNPHRQQETEFPVTWLPLEEVFRQADIVSLHCPLTGDNRGFVNEALFEIMKPQAILLNTARGALVNEDHLAAALTRKVIAGAAVDVVSSEPMDALNPLLGAPDCIITPHMAWATLAARQRLTSIAVGNVSAFLAGAPINLVNERFLRNGVPLVAAGEK